MSEADKLFEELGYTLVKDEEDGSLLECYAYVAKATGLEIFIGKNGIDDKIVAKLEYREDVWNSSWYGITIPELKAINAKVKELRME